MRKIFATAPLLSVAIFLGGCTLAPDYKRPDLAVPAALPAMGGAAADAGAQERLVADIGWQEFFTDERLRGVIELALANNRDLRIAAANVEQARAIYRVERSALLPSISADGTMTEQRPGGTAAQLYGSGTIENWSASVGAAWEIDLFGRIQSLSEAALEQFFATEQNRNAARISLIAETANTWLTLSADRQRLATAERTMQAFRQTYDLIKARFDNGSASGIDVRQAQTSYESARSDVANLRTLVQQDLNALTLLVGATVPETLLPAQGNEAPSTLAALPVGVSSEVLLQRPDVRAAEHELISANANIGAARAAFFPSISLTGMFGTMSSSFSGLFDAGTRTWSYTPTISLPIFSGGRNVANLRATEAARDAAVANYERTVQTAFREVADALARRATIDEQLDAQQSLEKAASELLQMSEARYRLGADSFLATLDAQRTHFAAQQSLIATRLARDVNLVDLYRTLGGGLK
ncbi:MAG TPA: efflux transporter outer membrane subunit [Pedomonas sp.]|uniref:efflux transporter outer membrane subunit n=1 Tax=Pedomonas sp. TaxID=2976421 RepID=UPI002F41D122